MGADSPNECIIVKRIADGRGWGRCHVRNFSSRGIVKLEDDCAASLQAVAGWTTASSDRSEFAVDSCICACLTRLHNGPLDRKLRPNIAFSRDKMGTAPIFSPNLRSSWGAG